MKFINKSKIDTQTLAYVLSGKTISEALRRVNKRGELVSLFSVLAPDGNVWAICTANNAVRVATQCGRG